MKKIIMLCVALQLAGSLQAMDKSKTRGEDLGDILIAQAAIGDLQLVRELIEDGAPVNYKNRDGSTALIEAANSGNIEIVHLLIDTMLKPTKEQKARTDALVGSLIKSQSLTRDTRKLIAQKQFQEFMPENKAMVLEQINKIRDQAAKQVLIKYVNQKTEQK